MRKTERLEHKKKCRKEKEKKTFSFFESILLKFDVVSHCKYKMEGFISEERIKQPNRKFKK